MNTGICLHNKKILGIRRCSVPVVYYQGYRVFNISYRLPRALSLPSFCVFSVRLAFMTLSATGIKYICSGTRMQLARSHSLINAGLSVTAHEQTQFFFYFKEIGKECQIQLKLQIVDCKCSTDVM